MNITNIVDCHPATVQTIAHPAVAKPDLSDADFASPEQTAYLSWQVGLQKGREGSGPKMVHCGSISAQFQRADYGSRLAEGLANR